MTNAPSPSDYLALAAKFDEARWGNGPGIGGADLLPVGLTHPATFTALPTAGRSARRLKLDGTWASLCCYVYEKLSGEPFPASNLRGRGFRSQANGETVVNLLKRLARSAGQSGQGQTIDGPRDY